MKQLFRCFIAVALVLFSLSCGKEEQAPSQEGLPLTYYNIAGIWELVEWNGAPLACGTFAYMELSRQGNFTTYSNISATSVVTTVETGTYDIDSDNSTVGGYFDFKDYQQWSHRYMVSDLTAEGMVWTAADDESEVRVYRRIEALPEGIAQQE